MLAHRLVRRVNDDGEIGDATGQPYHEARFRLDAIRKRVLEVCPKTKKDPMKGSILVGLVVPACFRMAEEFAKADAWLGMHRIACAAVLYKEDKGKFPETLNTLKPYFKEGLPKDPFTGKDYVYSLKDGLPCIECVPPDEMKKEAEQAGVPRSSIDFSARLKEDAEALKKFREEQKQKREEAKKGKGAEEPKPDD